MPDLNAGAAYMGIAMNSRERIRAALIGSDLDRVPLTEIGIWPETIKRWQDEGFPKDISPHEYFDLDTIDFFSFEPSLGFKEKIISRDKYFQVYTDGDGCTYKMFLKRPGSPLLLKSAVTKPEDWEAVKGNLQPAMQRFTEFMKGIVFGEDVTENQVSRYIKSKDKDSFSVIVPVEPCWYYLRLLGEEEALMTIAENPDFAGIIIEEYNNFTLEMLKLIFSQGYTFDALWVFSDLCYKNGMLFSPQFFKEKVFPHQKKLFDLGKENGLKIIYHSDGYIDEFLPLIIPAGIDCIQPLEVRAGNDAPGYLEKYPDTISFMGNINMDVFTTTKEEIEYEVKSKMLSMKDSHRYIFHSDHSVPDSVSLENYGFAIETAKEHAGY